MNISLGHRIVILHYAKYDPNGNCIFSKFYYDPKFQSLTLNDSVAPATDISGVTCSRQ